MPETDNLMHHIKCAPGQLGKYVILPGDPGRVEKIAAFLENPHHIQTYREYTTWNGTLEGETVTVMSTGMGGPSTAIGVEELKKCGAEVLIRVGTCGAIDPTLVPGTLIIPTGAIRKSGTGREYVPVEYPAVPNFDLVMELNAAAKRLGYPSVNGIVECKDSYYGQHAPETMPCEDELRSKWKAWQRAGAIGSEMESDTLYLVAGIRRMKAATVLLLCRNREREALTGQTDTCWDTAHAIETAIEAIRSIIRKEKEGK